MLRITYKFSVELPHSSLRATAANTPTATTPEDVSHSRGRNVEGKES